MFKRKTDLFLDIPVHKSLVKAGSEDYENMSLQQWSREKVRKCESLINCLDNNDSQNTSNREHDMKRNVFSKFL